METKARHTPAAGNGGPPGAPGGGCGGCRGERKGRMDGSNAGATVGVACRGVIDQCQ